MFRNPSLMRKEDVTDPGAEVCMDFNPDTLMVTGVGYAYNSFAKLVHYCCAGAEPTDNTETVVLFKRHYQVSNKQKDRKTPQKLLSVFVA